ncbi:DUF1054 family protein [Lacticaseibacillus porcinae]|uniref:DUF1054 family protein n=1 Tax=Lacticaseibacillus porcinae TaxID=1123687 RepID=UPI000F7996FE|nr:DUF1054 family protein [Lacticaseibacillus porcinae]
MFKETDFNVFDDQTLNGRLTRIRRDLDPKFEQAGTALVNRAQTRSGDLLYLHIAKHARRHKNPPVDTWLALSTSARGYKMLPHIELGFWDDRLFLWLAVLQEAKSLFPDLSGLSSTVLQLPADFQLSGDHTDKTGACALTPAHLTLQNDRYQTVKRGEWLVGKTYLRTDPLWQTPEALWVDIVEHFDQLLPIYRHLQ